MPIITVPIEETSATVGVTPGVSSTGNNIVAEAIIFGIALMVVYFIIRMFIALFPVILAVGAIGIAGYFGFKLL